MLESIYFSSSFESLYHRSDCVKHDMRIARNSYSMRVQNKVLVNAFLQYKLTKQISQKSEKLRFYAFFDSDNQTGAHG